MNKTFTLIFLLIGSFFVSCHDSYDICDKPRTVHLKSGFYQIISGIETASTVSSFTLQQINGGLLYDNKKMISKFTLSLAPTHDSLQFIIKLAEILPEDTLTITYSTKTETLSPECGVVNIYDISRVSVTNHAIDSVNLVSPSVNTTNGENIKIYY